MLIGYMRAQQKNEHGGDEFLGELEGAGCSRIFAEDIRSGRWDRPEMNRMIDYLRDDDVVVVWKLDHLSRSLKDLLSILDRIQIKGAGFRSLSEGVDTTTDGGKMMMQMLSAFAGFERDMIRERTRAGLEAARAQGRVGGRRPKLTSDQRKVALDMINRGKTQAQVARVFKVSPATISRLVARHRVSLD